MQGRIDIDNLMQRVRADIAARPLDLDLDERVAVLHAATFGTQSDLPEDRDAKDSRDGR